MSSSDGSRSQTVVAASVLAGTCFWLGYYLGKRQSTTSPLVGSTRQQQQAKYEKKDAPLWLQNLFDCQDHLRGKTTNGEMRTGGKAGT